MNTSYPTLSAALADEHRSRLHAEANAARLARLAGRTRGSRHLGTAAVFAVSRRLRARIALRQPVIIGRARAV